MELQKAFAYVRKTLFPQWDRKNQWTIVLKPDLLSPARCESEVKTIYFRGDPEKAYGPGESLNLYIVHEICHSSCPGHGKKWRDRMLRVAKRAEAQGQDDLAGKIRKHLMEYLEKGDVFCAPRIYGQIQGAVIDYGDKILEKPDECFDAIIEWIANDWGLNREELEKKYRRCRAVYDKAVSEYRKYFVKSSSVNRPSS